MGGQITPVGGAGRGRVVPGAARARGVRAWRCGAVLAAGVLVLSPGGPIAPVARAAGRELVVHAGGEAALFPPLAAFEVRDARTGRALAPAHDGLEEVLGGLPSVAVLDTGASSHVLSGATAERYGIAAEPGARYVEVGMTGEHAMAVSRPYTIALFADANGGRATSRPEPALLVAAQRLLVNESPPDLLAALSAPGASADVVGMPAIRRATVVLEQARAAGGGDLAEAALTGTRVAFLGEGASPAADVWVPLALVDCNRRAHPGNRGPLPSLAENPLVRGGRARLGRESASGDWLLDTGSVVTLVSTTLARALGLVDAQGRPRRTPEFTLPVGGISGAQRPLPGYHLERLEIPGEDGTTLVFEDVPVLVHDIAVTHDDGTRDVLDGVLGMNLFLASGTGFAATGFAGLLDSPFSRIVIDGRRGRLGLVTRAGRGR